MQKNCFILLLLISLNVIASENMDAKRQTAQEFINAIGDFDEVYDQFINLIKSQFDLYLRNHPDISDIDIEPYRSNVYITKDVYLDYQVAHLFEDFTISEIKELTEFFNSSIGKKWLLNKNNIGLKNMAMANEIFKNIRDKMDYDFQKTKPNQ